LHYAIKETNHGETVNIYLDGGKTEPIFYYVAKSIALNFPSNITIQKYHQSVFKPTIAASINLHDSQQNEILYLLQLLSPVVNVSFISYKITNYQSF